MNLTMKRAALTLLAIGLMAPTGVARAENPRNPTGGQFARNHPRRNQVNNRVKNQRQRINRAEASGKLTPQQARQLKANDRAIKRQEHADVKANGGYITPGQQRQLNREENANNRLINSESHP